MLRNGWLPAGARCALILGPALAALLSLALQRVARVHPWIRAITAGSDVGASLRSLVLDRVAEAPVEPHRSRARKQAGGKGRCPSCCDHAVVARLVVALPVDGHLHALTSGRGGCLRLTDDLEQRAAAFFLIARRVLNHPCGGLLNQVTVFPLARRVGDRARLIGKGAVFVDGLGPPAVALERFPALFRDGGSGALRFGRRWQSPCHRRRRRSFLRAAPSSGCARDDPKD